MLDQRLWSTDLQEATKSLHGRFVLSHYSNKKYLLFIACIGCIEGRSKKNCSIIPHRGSVEIWKFGNLDRYKIDLEHDFYSQNFFTAMYFAHH